MAEAPELGGDVAGESEQPALSKAEVERTRKRREEAQQTGEVVPEPTAVTPRELANDIKSAFTFITDLGAELEKAFKDLNLDDSAATSGSDEEGMPKMNKKKDWVYRIMWLSIVVWLCWSYLPVLLAGSVEMHFKVFCTIHGQSIPGENKLECRVDMLKQNFLERISLLGGDPVTTEECKREQSHFCGM